MTDRLSPQREAEMKPVGFYCDHSEEPYGARTHHDWEHVEGKGFVFQHQPETITALSHVEQTYLKPADREKRCARAVPVYAAPTVAAVRKERDEARARVDELETELADYTEPDVDGAGRTYESYHPQATPKGGAA
jgi:hypothetical protein